MKPSRFLSAVFLQFMGTVGSGIFVLPYLFAKSNFLFATFFLVYLTIITAFLNHFYVEIISSTPGDHQLTGYAQKYLGPKFKLVTTLNLILLACGAITAYSKLFQSFFILIIPQCSAISSIVYLITVIIIFALALSREREGLGFLLIPIFILLIPVVLFFIALNSPLEIRNLSLEISPSFMFYGATLFALSGFTIIPEVQETLGSNKKLFLAVFLGLILATITYFLFAFSVIRLSGPSLTVDSVTGLFRTFPVIALVLAIFGMVVTSKSTANFLIILRELFYRDLKISLPLSQMLPLLFPLVVLALTSVSLITIMSLTGHITIFVSAVIICLIRFRLPHNFSTLFISLLILLSLFFGLAGAFLN